MFKNLRLALPNKGIMEKGAAACLEKAGFPPARSNLRQYTGSLPNLPGVEVHYQRNADMYEKLNDGQLDVAITGYDNFVEAHTAGDPVFVLQTGLGFGVCELVLAVPERWLDIVSIGDFAEMAARRKAQNRPLRIATKYTNTARSWLHERGITQCLLVQASGALEAAPALGYADCIVDLTASGITLRENRLKRIQGGRLLRSEGCLLAGRNQLRARADKCETLAILLEGIVARHRASQFCCLRATLPELRELPALFPNINLYEEMSSGGGRFLVEITVELADKWSAIQSLRERSASRIQEIPLAAIYDPQVSALERINALLESRE